MEPNAVPTAAAAAATAAATDPCATCSTELIEQFRASAAACASHTIEIVDGPAPAPSSAAEEEGPVTESEDVPEKPEQPETVPALSPRAVTERLAAAADAARLRAANAGALTAKAVYGAPTLGGRKLADVGEYKNPYQFGRRGLDILMVALADGFVQVWAAKGADPWFCVSTGPVKCDYVSLLKASAKKKDKQLLVVPSGEADGVGAPHMLAAGPFDKKAGAFTALDWCFPMTPRGYGEAMACRQTICELRARAKKNGRLSELAFLAALASAQR